MSYNYQEFSFQTTGGSNGQDLLSLSQGGSQVGSVSYSVSSSGAAGSNGLVGLSVSSGSVGQSGGVNQIAQDLLALAGGSNSASLSQSSAVAVSSSASNAGFLSSVEQAILRSNVPIEVNETEEITVLGQRGIWANRAEVVNWRGVIPITEYVINEDANPEVITKRVSQQLEYIQELAIRYLRPPTPPAPGEIFIQQEVNTLTPPAPPLIIRQQPARPDTPEPLVIREAPPEPPRAVGRKVITISGKRIPPPPRKVVIERLAPLPAKPQSVLVERWLPYSQVKRRVVFQRAAQVDAQVVRPRNVIVQWEAPSVVVRKEVKYLGVVRANPVEYVQRYGASLKVARELPQFVLDIKTPDGLVLAADYRYNEVHELEGELQALRLVDLDREGLGEYRAQLQRLGISYAGAGATFSLSSNNNGSFGASYGASFGAPFAGSALGLSAGASASSSLVAEVFAQVDRDNNGSLSVEEAEKVLLRLNSRLGRNYGEDDVRSFFRALDRNGDGVINLQEFRAAFERLL